MWEPDEIRLLRWFMRMAGVGLLIPGVIYLLSWPDTLRAFAAWTGPGLAPIPAALSIALLIVGGLSFILARHARAGAAAAGFALLMGAWIHAQWAAIMHQRLGMIPESITDQQRAMLEDTIQFAANAQIPHILKNLVLVGVCGVVFILGPRLCGSRVRPRGETGE